MIVGEYSPPRSNRIAEAAPPSAGVSLEQNHLAVLHDVTRFELQEVDSARCPDPVVIETIPRDSVMILRHRLVQQRADQSTFDVVDSYRHVALRRQAKPDRRSKPARRPIVVTGLNGFGDGCSRTVATGSSGVSGIAVGRHPITGSAPISCAHGLFAGESGDAADNEKSPSIVTVVSHSDA